LCQSAGPLQRVVGHSGPGSPLQKGGQDCDCSPCGVHGLICFLLETLSLSLLSFENFYTSIAFKQSHPMRAGFRYGRVSAGLWYKIGWSL